MWPFISDFVVNVLSCQHFRLLGHSQHLPLLAFCLWFRGAPRFRSWPSPKSWYWKLGLHNIYVYVAHFLMHLFSALIRCHSSRPVFFVWLSLVAACNSNAWTIFSGRRHFLFESNRFSFKLTYEYYCHWCLYVAWISLCRHLPQVLRLNSKSC